MWHDAQAAGTAKHIKGLRFQQCLVLWIVIKIKEVMQYYNPLHTEEEWQDIIQRDKTVIKIIYSLTVTMQ